MYRATYIASFAANNVLHAATYVAMYIFDTK